MCTASEHALEMHEEVTTPRQSLHEIDKMTSDEPKTPINRIYSDAFYTYAFSLAPLVGEGDAGTARQPKHVAHK